MLAGPHRRGGTRPAVVVDVGAGPLARHPTLPMPTSGRRRRPPPRSSRPRRRRERLPAREHRSSGVEFHKEPPRCARRRSAWTPSHRTIAHRSPRRWRPRWPAPRLHGLHRRCARAARSRHPPNVIESAPCSSMNHCEPAIPERLVAVELAPAQHEGILHPDAVADQWKPASEHPVEVGHSAPRTDIVWLWLSGLRRRQGNAPGSSLYREALWNVARTNRRSGSSPERHQTAKRIGRPHHPASAPRSRGFGPRSLI